MLMWCSVLLLCFSVFMVLVKLVGVVLVVMVCIFICLVVIVLFIVVFRVVGVVRLKGGRLLSGLV